jgi:hypothetical protein
VSTVKKSQATTVAACVRMNVRHDGPLRRGAGGIPWLRSALRTEDSETDQPSLTSSPTMRRWPQRGFSRARRTTKARGAHLFDLGAWACGLLRVLLSTVWVSGWGSWGVVVR